MKICAQSKDYVKEILPGLHCRSKSLWRSLLQPLSLCGFNKRHSHRRGCSGYHNRERECKEDLQSKRRTAWGWTELWLLIVHWTKQNTNTKNIQAGKKKKNSEAEMDFVVNHVMNMLMLCDRALPHPIIHDKLWYYQYSGHASIFVFVLNCNFEVVFYFCWFLSDLMSEDSQSSR